ncbi:glycosyltransferase family 4 protein [Anaerocolumna aminovalerica]|uniref:Glycosyltransferase involved in cell wall bisynthesis n=1 Tax=Anaerocolumna aminovalerica TaxID=1527 RepID=A0A1I5EFK8_9FIRM|nr:glycosyltransferase family 4 protein [Anaerocolumna aminovalerica]SFO10284.1 Glycosyltransferase involved in cell wall bisynthesis [Anaerocolumna aminovalerica]
MKIAIATVQVPFIKGGAEILTNMLCEELKKRGHKADIISIPFKWYPSSTLLDCMFMGRTMDLSEVNGEKIDRVIAMKFPAYYVKHDNKILWLMHQHRQAYDLWNTKYGDLQNMPNGEFVKNMIIKHDNKYIAEAKKIYTIANNTSKRLMKYNGIESETLYHPPLNYEKMHCDAYGNYIFYASRIDPMKRQRLLVESARYIKSDAKIVIAGSGSKNELDYISNLINKYNLKDKVKMVDYISEEEKIDYYAKCLGVYFGAYDEDYGYITLESFFSKKPVIVHKDAGGPLEFVIDGENGYIIDEDAKILAEKIDELFFDRNKAKKMGKEGYESLKNKHIDWDYVIDKLLQ